MEVGLRSLAIESVEDKDSDGPLMKHSSALPASLNKKWTKTCFDL